jgi:uncharacterized membrane protein
MVFSVKLYLLTVPIFFLVDLLWLGVVARDVYQSRLGHLLASEVNWIAAMIFYLIYITGILLFAVVPGLAADSLRKTMRWAAAFGFFTYMTYELTNAATLPEWPWSIVIIDTLWGVALCTVVALASHLIGLRLKKYASPDPAGD